MGLLNSLRYRIVKCPRCTGKLRLPIRPGKVLRVTCSHCSQEFDANFRTATPAGAWKTLPVGVRKGIMGTGLLLIGVLLGLWLGSSTNWSEVLGPYLGGGVQ